VRYVIAVGGNALTDEKVLKSLSDAVFALRKRDAEIIITHGNGPQVGELALVEKKNLAVLTAQTEAELGLEIEQSLAEAKNRGGATEPAIVLTRVRVDARDAEFRHPTKPIGPFIGKALARGIARKGMVVRKLIHGYRRVVPSPMPREILEAGLIRRLLRDGYVVIAAGGGGIAVVRKGKRLAYADAVLDKDLTSSLLAATLKADRFVILTDVDGAFLDFNTPLSRMIRRASAKEMAGHIAAGQFEEGSMLPKVEACVEFVKRTGKPAAIGNLGNVRSVLNLEKATLITP
jgi:carbamate kinase